MVNYLNCNSFSDWTQPLFEHKLWQSLSAQENGNKQCRLMKMLSATKYKPLTHQKQLKVSRIDRNLLNDASPCTRKMLSSNNQ